MARKRKGLKGLDAKGTAYWEILLTREGFSMAAGRNNRLTYVGDSATIESIDSQSRGAEKGKVRERSEN